MIETTRSRPGHRGDAALPSGGPAVGTGCRRVRDPSQRTAASRRTRGRCAESVPPGGQRAVVCAEAVAGRDLLLGIRPEHFEDASMVDEAERLGDSQHACIPHEAPGPVVEKLNRAVHVFDPGTAQNLTRDRQAGAQPTRTGVSSRAGRRGGRAAHVVKRSTRAYVRGA